MCFSIIIWSVITVIMSYESFVTSSVGNYICWWLNYQLIIRAIAMKTDGQDGSYGHKRLHSAILFRWDEIWYNRINNDRHNLNILWIHADAFLYIFLYLSQLNICIIITTYFRRTVFTYIYHIQRICHENKKTYVICKAVLNTTSILPTFLNIHVYSYIHTYM